MAAQPFHQALSLLEIPIPGGVFFKPFSKGIIERPMLCSRGLACPVNQVLVRTQGDVFHGTSVHYFSAH